MPNQVGLLPPQTKTEALADLARHPAVGGWKNLAVHLNPALDEDPEAAGKWLHRALDQNSRDAFHDRHMRRALRLGATIGCHTLWRWHSEDVGYNGGDPLESKSRRLMLREEDERLAHRRTQIENEFAEMDKNEAVAEVRRLGK